MTMNNITKISYKDTQKVRQIGKEIDEQGIHSYSAVHKSIRYLLGYTWTFIKDGQKRAEYVYHKCSEHLWWSADRLNLLWEDVVNACRYRSYTKWVPREAFSSGPPDPHIWNKNFRTRTNSINTIAKQKKHLRPEPETPEQIRELVARSKAMYNAGLEAAKQRLKAGKMPAVLDILREMNSS
jgi:hypothetical protein